MRVFVYIGNKIFVQRDHSFVGQDRERVDRTLIHRLNDADCAVLFVLDRVTHQVLPREHILFVLGHIASTNPDLLSDQFGWTAVFVSWAVLSFVGVLMIMAARRVVKKNESC